MAPRY